MIRIALNIVWQLLFEFIHDLDKFIKVLREYIHFYVSYIITNYGNLIDEFGVTGYELVGKNSGSGFFYELQPGETRQYSYSTKIYETGNFTVRAYVQSTDNNQTKRISETNQTLEWKY